MRYHALAADYDGTLAHHGVIDDATWAALRKLKDSGRKLIMVTGRELDELLGLLKHAEVFDRIVAENGALVYTPATKQTRTVAPGPPAAFVAELQKRGVERISVGRVIVATWEPHQDTVLHVIRDQGLELQVIFNKGAVMVLPSGVNKATGLAAALVDLRLSAHNVVGVGDAENDHALLAACECGVAVDNALTSLKEAADLVMKGDHGRGIAELVEHMVGDDLAFAASRLKRHRVLLGKGDGREISLDPYTTSSMICGTSGSGKSTLTTGLLERLSAGGYQFAVIDPEGDYASIDFAVVLGGSTRAPLVEEILDVLADPARNVVINMLGVAVEHRPEFCARLLPALSDLRTRTGRPHFLVIDEAHHMLPAQWKAGIDVPVRPRGTLYVTVHPGSVAPSIIGTLESVLAVGEHPEVTLNELADAARLAHPRCPIVERLPPGHTMYWKLGEDPIEVATEPPHAERTRHSRKYTEGNLGNERSFFFRGPEDKLKLRAHNLHMFMLIAEGIDDETWQYHLERRDYSNWMRQEIKDADLATAVAKVETADLPAAESRVAIRKAIAERYTLPSDVPSGLIDPVDQHRVAS